MIPSVAKIAKMISAFMAVTPIEEVNLLQYIFDLADIITYLLSQYQVSVNLV
jgi:hypothetical protein